MKHVPLYKYNYIMAISDIREKGLISQFQKN